MGSILHMKVMPADGSGDTLFADMVGAFEALPSERQQQLLTLQAKHLFHKNASLEAIKALNPQMAACFKLVPEVCHPVVRTHPETGRKSLFVSEGFTTYIAGMEEGESKALLEWLYAYTTQEKFVYRHKWVEGDMVFWDNRMLLHFGTWGGKGWEGEWEAGRGMVDSFRFFFDAHTHTHSHGFQAASHALPDDDQGGRGLLRAVSEKERG